METIDALGVVLTVSFDSLTGNGRSEPRFDISHEPDLIEIADGCADISVVTIGTLSACGIDAEPLLELVDRNNLAKFGPGHSRREDGKLIKPPGHKPPDIAGLLESQSH